MNEDILWQRIKQNDGQALKIIFESHYKPLCYYTLQFTKRMPEAEDIAQIVFIKFWEKRHEFDINTSIKAYLYRSAYNAYIDKYRKRRQQQEFLESLKHEALSNELAEDNSIFQERIEKVKALIDTLPSRCKEILLLSKREDYKHREIAEQLGISVKTVEAQLSIAFKKIRAGFDDDNFIFFIAINTF